MKIRKTKELMIDRIIIVGGLANSKWQGEAIREQERVLSIDGISKAIPSTYDRHPFKIQETIHEDIEDTTSNETGIH